MSLEISVVVPTFRRPGLLDRCLEALLSQDLDPYSCEVIVVDDARCVEAKEVVEKWAGRGIASVRYLQASGRGPAAARNAGWTAARGRVIAFTDDDCVPSPGWLSTGLAHFNDGVVGAWGRVLVPLPANPSDYERNAACLSTAEFVTANCFYKRETIAAAGGFDERFTMAWREDSDLRFRVEKLGKLTQAPHSEVTHPVRPAGWGVSLRQQKKSQFNALLYKKHPELYRRRIQPSPPWHYYRILGFLLGAVGFSLTRKRRLAVMAALGWALLTGRFCAARLEGTSHAPGHVLEMAITSVLIPPLAVFWRLVGAWKFRVPFL